MCASIFKSTAILGLMSGFALAAVYEVEYSPSEGKKSGSVVVSASDAMTRDTIRIGALPIFVALGTDKLLTVCGFKPPTMVQFPFGWVRQSADTNSNWNEISGIPSTGLNELDSVTTYTQSMGDSVAAPGFELYKSGQNNTCNGAEYILAPRWNRVVFVRFGSGVDYRVKLSFQAVDDTLYVAPPSHTTFHILRSVRLDYVINANSNDLAGPISIRHRRVPRFGTASGDWRTMNVYNLLGVRIKREVGPHEVVIPLRR